ncbi:MAG: hypothetical protein MSD82_06025 [Prevotella sp.]|nr:hypothetical protein [Prevotella sp.]
MNAILSTTMKLAALLAVICLTLASCTEDYSNGEKVGNLIEFTHKGIFWKSWEGRLNLTQTGMNTSGEPFSCSFDNDRKGQDSLIALMKQAQVEGWKLKIRYHEVFGWNWFSNRGETDYFIDDVTVLDRNFARPLQQIRGNGSTVRDTVWVVIDKAQVREALRERHAASGNRQPE